jgi:hypothetical protein
MSIDRLKELQEENNQKLLEMITESGRFAALADRENNGLKPKAISSFNLFQTPENIADKMASMIPDFLPNAPTILEPSAGLGRLYGAAKAKIKGGLYDLIDNSKDCTKELYNISGPGTRITEKDFLSVKPATGGNGSLIIKELTWAFYDVVIMNPPFKMGRDIKHILHAVKFLHSEGILIALCYNGVKQNKVLKPIADTWEVLPKNSFKSEGTGAEVVLLTIKGSN